MKIRSVRGKVIGVQKKQSNSGKGTYLEAEVQVTFRWHASMEPEKRKFLGKTLKDLGAEKLSDLIGKEVSCVFSLQDDSNDDYGDAAKLKLSFLNAPFDPNKPRRVTYDPGSFIPDEEGNIEPKPYEENDEIPFGKEGCGDEKE